MEDLPNKGFHHSCHNLVVSTPKPGKQDGGGKHSKKRSAPEGLAFSMITPALSAGAAKRAKIIAQAAENEARLEAQMRDSGKQEGSPRRMW